MERLEVASYVVDRHHDAGRAVGHRCLVADRNVGQVGVEQLDVERATGVVRLVADLPCHRLAEREGLVAATPFLPMDHAPGMLRVAGMPFPRSAEIAEQRRGVSPCESGTVVIDHDPRQSARQILVRELDMDVASIGVEAIPN